VQCPKIDRKKEGVHLEGFRKRVYRKVLKTSGLSKEEEGCATARRKKMEP